MTDPIADFLTRIRNGLKANKRWVDIPASKMKKRIAYILREEKYIDNFIFIKDGIREDIRVFLKYDREGRPVISNLERISKPGRRIYVNSSEIPRVLAGMGISILSTSKGVISNKAAKRLNVGGEVICNIW
jgi:small subunit ribosomal protein S8